MVNIILCKSAACIDLDCYISYLVLYIFFGSQCLSGSFVKKIIKEFIILAVVSC